MFVPALSLAKRNRRRLLFTGRPACCRRIARLCLEHKSYLPNIPHDAISVIDNLHVAGSDVFDAVVDIFSR